MALPELAELGERIAIIGPAASGKSTLAAALAQKTEVPLVHLDQLFHRPGTEWVPRPEAEFKQLHAETVASPSWVMDGNYSRHLPERLARATGVIWLAPPVPICLSRYLRRCFTSGQRRAGGLPGGSERIKWHMLRHIVVVQPKSVPKMERLVTENGKPLVLLRRSARVRAAYVKWGLVRHDRT